MTITRFVRLLLSSVFFCGTLVVTSCNDEKQLSYGDLSIEYFAKLSDNVDSIDANLVWREIQRLAKCDTDTMPADVYTRAYYNKGGAFIWLDRCGIDYQADSLVAFLDTVHLAGFNTKNLDLQRIHSDLANIRNFNPDETEDFSFSKTIAFLEYNLTKGLLRCGVGLHYGVTNPFKLFNKLDVKDSDSVRVTYRELFDVPVHVAGPKTFAYAMNRVAQDSLAAFLNEAEPQTPLYWRLKRMLANSIGSERNRILVNMERERWRTPTNYTADKEYVLVNIPAYHLWAVRDGEVLDMRIGCGTRSTKTPLLNSRIERMEVNPVWIIPGSIVKHDIIHHAGDGEYFDSRRYYAQHRSTGKKLYGDDITYEVLASGNYFIVQQGGAGNSLGRIIFRFKNNHAVYLHDTSSRGFFERGDRSVSHGCVRVEKPYDLAAFMLRNSDDEKAEKIKYSMEADLKSEDVDKKMLIYNVKVEPNIPVYLTYYTMLLTPEGRLETYPDVYGYDAVMQPYVVQ